MNCGSLSWPVICISQLLNTVQHTTVLYQIKSVGAISNL